MTGEDGGLWCSLCDTKCRCVVELNDEWVHCDPIYAILKLFSFVDDKLVRAVNWNCQCVLRAGSCGTYYSVFNYLT